MPMTETEFLRLTSPSSPHALFETLIDHLRGIGWHDAVRRVEEAWEPSETNEDEQYQETKTAQAFEAGAGI